MAAGTKRPNLQTGAARRHSLHRKLARFRSNILLNPRASHGLICPDMEHDVRDRGETLIYETSKSVPAFRLAFTAWAALSPSYLAFFIRRAEPSGDIGYSSQAPEQV